MNETSSRVLQPLMADIETPVTDKGSLMEYVPNLSSWQSSFTSLLGKESKSLTNVLTTLQEHHEIFIDLIESISVVMAEVIHLNQFFASLIILNVKDQLTNKFRVQFPSTLVKGCYNATVN
jgi:hypothetical protein